MSRRLVLTLGLLPIVAAGLLVDSPPPAYSALSVVTAIPVSAHPERVVLNPVTHRLYVTHEDEDLLTVIDTKSKTVLLATTICEDAWQVAVNTVTNKIYVGCRDQDVVAVVDGVTNAIALIPTIDNPNSVAVDEATNRYFVAEGGFGAQVRAYDGSTNSAICTVSLAVGPDPLVDDSLAVNPNNGRVFVTLQGNGHWYSMLDGSNCGILANKLPLPCDRPWFPVYNPADNRFYGTRFLQSTVLVADGTIGTPIACPGLGAGGGYGTAINVPAQVLYASMTNPARLYRVDLSGYPAGFTSPEFYTAGYELRGTAVDHNLCETFTAGYDVAQILVLRDDPSQTDNDAPGGAFGGTPAWIAPAIC